MHDDGGDAGDQDADLVAQDGAIVAAAAAAAMLLLTMMILCTILFMTVLIVDRM